MFDPNDTPRIFGLPPGVDFASALVDGLIARSGQMKPDDWARTVIYVNTSRLQRRIRTVFDAGPPRLLPKVRLISDLANDPVSHALPPPVSSLRRRLELSQFVSALLERQPDLAPKAALYDLSDSLADLMDEMQGEGVTPEVIGGLDVTDQSGHWERALAFLRIITPFFSTSSDAPDKEARQRLVIEMLAEQWADKPPHPVIVAGSTGSRGATALFMQAVSKLPQGAIILPGFDFDLPQSVWSSMDDAMAAQDHPQYRFRMLMDQIGFSRDDVSEWADAPPANAARNELISLSLRPAPVTDQWLTEGKDLANIEEATQQLTLVEAASPRAEAETIALRLREAAGDGITAALISPDRVLTRQVTAALSRWDIIPDDSAGIPLALSAPGRTLRHVADMMGKPLTAEALLTVLKHPLCHSSNNDRGDHLRHTRDLELYLRRKANPFPDAAALTEWAEKKEDRHGWAAWLAELIAPLTRSVIAPLADHVASHLSLAEALCGGPDGKDAGGLWDEAAGREARRICDMLIANADAGGSMGNADYAVLFGAILAEGTVRNPDAGQSNILIWGTLEARVQAADLIVLGGMNEGVWPEMPPPDPWLNRKMRAEAGLLLPERRIGLSAHDYQQAIAGAEVWITRAKRSADAETVPSRWVNRLINLLNGLPEKGGKVALEAMRNKGQRYMDMAAALAAPSDRTAPAPRPSPCPPVQNRPDKISITQLKTLIRDPYAIYARKVLRLDPLDPLVPSADAPLRGTIIHAILQRFIDEKHDPSDKGAFMGIAKELFLRDCPWPTMRAVWLARLGRITDQLLADEVERQALASSIRTEAYGRIALPQSGMVLHGKADRIDLTDAGDVLVYDYKTGVIPSEKQQLLFDKQLLAEAAMIERGAFEDIGERSVDAAYFLGVGSDTKSVAAPLKKAPSDQVWEELETLFGHWQQKQRGYTARLAMFSKNDFNSYDHLSRYGEWDTSQIAERQDLQ